MSDSRLARLADVLVGYSTAVREGDLVLIEAPELAAPLLAEIYQRVLAAGGHPVTRIAIEGLSDVFYREASEEQLDWLSPVRAAEIEEIDVRIAVEASSNTRSLTSVDPSRLARHSRAQQSL